MELLYLSILSAISILLIFLAFIVGLHYGSKIRNEKDINIPNPIKMVKNHIEEEKVKQQKELEQQIEEINLANIDAYDGTSLGQKDFPS